MKSIQHVVFLTLILATMASAAGAADVPSAKGSVVATIILPVPAGQDRDYLGLAGAGYFRIPQLKARVVIVEVFSMYCPHCQKSAPRVNELYEAIEADPNLKGRVKLIGIGAGNSSYEVAVFKKKYGIPFPLFADEDYAIHKALGEVRTPFFVGIRNNADQTFRVFYSEPGGFEQAREFLDLILRLSDTHQEE